MGAQRWVRRRRSGGKRVGGRWARQQRMGRARGLWLRPLRGLAAGSVGNGGGSEQQRVSCVEERGICSIAVMVRLGMFAHSSGTVAGAGWHTHAPCEWGVLHGARCWQGAGTPMQPS